MMHSVSVIILIDTWSRIGDLSPDLTETSDLSREMTETSDLSPDLIET